MLLGEHFSPGGSFRKMLSSVCTLLYAACADSGRIDKLGYGQVCFEGVTPISFSEDILEICYAWNFLTCSGSTFNPGLGLFASRKNKVDSNLSPNLRILVLPKQGKSEVLLPNTAGFADCTITYLSPLGQKKWAIFRSLTAWQVCLIMPSASSTQAIIVEWSCHSGVPQATVAHFRL
jgi:hypothetical protein